MQPDLNAAPQALPVGCPRPGDLIVANDYPDLGELEVIRVTPYPYFPDLATLNLTGLKNRRFLACYDRRRTRWFKRVGSRE